MVLSMICIVLAAVCAAALGYTIGRQPKQKPTIPKPSEEQTRREQELQHDFETISGYNLSKALEHKRGI